MTEKTVLVIGAKGTLGQALIQEFENHSYKVVAWDKEEIDISDFDSVRTKIDGLKPDIVINSAAINAVDAIEDNDELYNFAKSVNCKGPGYVAQVCNSLNIIFVHYSTDYIFDGTAQSGYSETDKPNPISRYGLEKLNGEKEVRKKGGKYYIIRISRLFGKSGEAEGSKMSFVDLMISMVKDKGKDELEVVNDETSSPAYAPDVADFTRKLIESGKEYGIYHGSNEGLCTWFDFAKKIFEISGLDVKVTPVPSGHFPQSAKRPKYSVLINSKFDKQRDWEDALEEYLNA